MSKKNNKSFADEVRHQAKLNENAKIEVCELDNVGADRLFDAIKTAQQHQRKCWCGETAVLMGWCFDHIPVRAGFRQHMPISAKQGIDQIDEILFEVTMIDTSGPWWLVEEKLKSALENINTIVQAVKQK